MHEALARVRQAMASDGVALMGILNITPDSFYDGTRFLDAEAAKLQVDRLLHEGADIIDIGGESSRPGSARVPPDEQIARIEPAVRHAVARGALVSIDTTDPAVADRMLSAGARIINDVSCLSDPELARVSAVRGATLVIMHSRGAMSSMRDFSVYDDSGYDDVVARVIGEWQGARDRAVAQGLPPENIWLDPGLGFHKNAQQSLTLLRRLKSFTAVSEIVVVGHSRKSFLASVHQAPPEQRLGGSIAAALTAVTNGASILRVHDVRDTKQAVLVARALATPP